MILDKHLAKKSWESWQKTVAEFEDLPFNLREEVTASFKGSAVKEELPEMHQFYIK